MEEAEFSSTQLNYQAAEVEHSNNHGSAKVPQK